MSNGKGSGRRGIQVSREEYERNWNAVFGRKCPKCGKRILNPDSALKNTDVALCAACL